MHRLLPRSKCLFVSPGLLMLEASVVVYLLQGHLVSDAPEACHPASPPSLPLPVSRGLAWVLQAQVLMACDKDEAVASRCATYEMRSCDMQVLMRTILASGAFALLDSVVAAVAVFGMRTPLFLHGCAAVPGRLSRHLCHPLAAGHPAHLSTLQ